MGQSNNEAMIYLFLFFLEISILFFLSKAISFTLSRFLSIPVLSLLFFPGVVVHELSHMLVASILFVRVGDVEFKPKVIDNALKLGSVEIGKTDPIRRAIIGFAPVGVGISLILGIVYFVSGNLPYFWENQIFISIIIVLGILYLLFVISNTMFSSKADMEGTLELLIIALIIIIALYLIGPRFPEFIIKFLSSKEIVGIVQKSSIFLIAPIVVDLVILGIVRTLADGRR